MSKTDPPADPPPELHKRNRARLAYTRQRGWVVVKGPEILTGGLERWHTRPGNVSVYKLDILAWAELPPVPEDAA